MPAATKSTRDPRDTPAMRQYRRFKEQHPDCILLFRMGDFYEMFDDDAVTVAKALNITLTQRTAGIPMAGVPYHAVETYLRRLIAMGHRVAVCDQVQDPKEAKGVVDRAVTRVLTPGTLVEDHLLEEGAANQVAAIVFTDSGDDAPAALAIAELSTGRFTLHDIPAGRAIDEIARLAPTELLYVETANGAVPPRVAAARDQLGCALTARPGWTFRHNDALEHLCRHYGVSTLAGFGLDDGDQAVGPAGALLRYLEETHAPNGADDEPSAERRPLAHLRPPKRLAADDHLIIDATSLRALEVERTMRTGESQGSLLATIQRCRTAMGKRLLRQWLCFPLRDAHAIGARQEAVAALLDDRDHADRLAEQIDGMQDVARIAGRVALGRATPRDLVALGRSVARIDGLAGLLDEREALVARAGALRGLAETLAPLAESIQQRCVDEPPAHMREGGLFRDGVDAELDEVRSLQRDANTWLASYQKRLIEETGIPSLKVGYNKVFGYYIEITHAHREKLDGNLGAPLTRKQTLKNAERYITPDLKHFEDKVTTAETRAIERERVLFERLVQQAARHAEALSEYADQVAEIDVLMNFAEIAARFGYCRPEIVDEPVLAIEAGRHPVLDRMLGEKFVPNDCALGTDVEPKDGDQPDAATSGPSSLALITGPNMAGKSTFIRQVALMTLLAHTGSFVPATRARIGLTDRIFTRIGASDELHTGQSTFMVEMTETAKILHHATERSLVILDEIGRGTSTLDGLSLAWAIAETIAQHKCRTLFATHYHELTTLAEQIEGVRNLHVAVREWGDEIIFLYRILPGSTDRSYGIHVAKIAGLPPKTIDRARQLLETLAVETDRASHAATPSDAGRRPDAQMNLFTEYLDHPVLDRIRQLDLNDLSPMQAFDALRQLKEQAEQS